MKRHTCRDKQAKGHSLHVADQRRTLAPEEPQQRGGPRNHKGFWCVRRSRLTFTHGHHHVHFFVESVEGARKDLRTNLAQVWPESYGPECYYGLDDGLSYSAARELARELRQAEAVRSA